MCRTLVGPVWWLRNLHRGLLAGVLRCGSALCGSAVSYAFLCAPLLVSVHWSLADSSLLPEPADGDDANRNVLHRVRKDVLQLLLIDPDLLGGTFCTAGQHDRCHEH